MIEGKWKLVSGETDGQEIPDSDLQNSTLEIVEDRHQVQLGEEAIEGTHELAADQDPMTIDAADTLGPFAGQTTLGILKLEGDEFTVCFAPPGQPRPSEFTTKDGKATILHVWQRCEG
jgi:uncharacterized protein (TIGR03067 family)